jgi:drug/metabolite transporter (DMT)-like permease
VPSTLAHRWNALPGNARGALWVLVAAALFAVMAAAAKVLGNDVLGADGEVLHGALPSFQVTFFRSLAALLTTLPFLLRHGSRLLRSGRPGLAVLRGVAGASGMMCNFYAMIHLELATAISLSFARPLFLLVLAAVVLREAVNGSRIGATIVGFLGVLVIVRPGAGLEPAALIALAGALLIAGSIVCVRILSRTDSTVTLLFYSGVAGTLFTAVPAIAAWEWPTAEQWLLVLVMAVFGVAGQSCFMKGYAAGEASALAPFDYTRLLFATALGFVLFGTLPEPLVWVGSALLLGATWFTLLDDRRRRRADDAPQAGAPRGVTPTAGDRALARGSRREDAS